MCHAIVCQAFRNEAFVVGWNRDIVWFVKRKRLQRAKIAGRLDQYFAAGVDKELSKQVERLLRAGDD